MARAAVDERPVARHRRVFPSTAQREPVSIIPTKGNRERSGPGGERFHFAWNAITGDPTKMEMIVRGGVTRVTSWLFDAAYAAGLVGTAFVAMLGSSPPSTKRSWVSSMAR